MLLMEQDENGVGHGSQNHFTTTDVKMPRLQRGAKSAALRNRRASQARDGRAKGPSHVYARTAACRDP
jgi:hypothetical protein